jgi:hypothetical protein
MRTVNEEELVRLQLDGFKNLASVTAGLMAENIAYNPYRDRILDRIHPTKRGRNVGETSSAVELPNAFAILKDALAESLPGQPIAYRYPLFRNTIQLDLNDFVEASPAAQSNGSRLFISPQGRAALTDYFEANTFKQQRLADDTRDQEQDSRDSTAAWTARSQSKKAARVERRNAEEVRLQQFRERFISSGEFPAINLSSLLYDAEFTRQQKQFIVGRIREAVKTPLPHDQKTGLSEGAFMYAGLRLRVSHVFDGKDNMYVGGDSAEKLISYFHPHALTPDQAIEILTRKILVQGGAPSLGKRQ